MFSETFPPIPDLDDVCTCVYQRDGEHKQSYRRVSEKAGIGEEACFPVC